MNIDLSKLPEELRRSGRFLLWRLQDTDRPRCKVPLNSAGRFIDPVNPENWLALDLVMAASLEPNPKYKDEDNPVGVGLAISTPYFAVDLDKCYDPQTGAVEEWAKEILKRLPRTYTELSPSRKGFHLWYRCPEHVKLPDGIRAEKAEVYARKRYFTVTGLRLEAGLTQVTEVPLNQALTIFNLISDLKEKPKATTKTETVEKSPPIGELMTRADFPDLSVAVHQLLIKLFMEDPEHREAVEERFKKSALFTQTHWKEKWPRLGPQELDKAYARAKENLAHRKREDVNQYSQKLQVVDLDQVRPKVLEWLWPERVAMGTVTVFAGPPGVGKSLLGLELASRGSLGAHHVDKKPNSIGVFKTLLLSMEDDRETILVPRFKVAGADLSKIKALDMVEYRDDSDEVKGARLVNLEQDLMKIQELIQQDPTFKLVIIDPLSNYMNGKSMYNDQELRTILMPIAKMAQETGVAVIVVIHNSKQNGRTGLEKIGVSLGGVGVARMAWMFLPTEEKTTQVLQVKKNLGNYQGFVFTTEGQPLEIDGRKTEQARVKFVGESDASAEAVLQSMEDPEDRKDRRIFKLFESAIPKGKEVPAEEVLSAGEKLGLSRQAVQKARERCGVATQRKGGQWLWRWMDEGRQKKSDGPGLF